MHFSLIRISPPGANPTHALDDVMLPLYYALLSLGFKAEIRLNDYNPNSINIIFGSMLTPRKVDREAPRGSVIVNLEQTGSRWFTREYLEHLSKFRVWDYSERNIKGLEKLGIAASHLPLGYAPEMTRLSPHEPEIDVLFYGFLNKRRQELLRRLEDTGIRLMVEQNAFGPERDKLLAGAKIVLNIHFYSPAILEVVRLGYVWANRLAVVSERGQDTEVPPGLEKACAFFPYNKLVDGVLELLADDERRREQAERGFEAFCAIPLREALKKLVGERKHSAEGMEEMRPALRDWYIAGPMGE